MPSYWIFGSVLAQRYDTYLYLQYLHVIICRIYVYEMRCFSIDVPLICYDVSRISPVERDNFNTVTMNSDDVTFELGV